MTGVATGPDEPGGGRVVAGVLLAERNFECAKESLLPGIEMGSVCAPGAVPGSEFEF